MPDGWSFWDEDGNGNVDRWECYKQAEYLTKNLGFTGYFEGDPTEYPAAEYGMKVVELPNLSDWGGVRDFTAPDYPDECFPGIDDWVDPADDPDDDNQFAALVQGCVELTEGLHIFGTAFDDGAMIRIGGVEIGRSNDWNETSFWMFEAPVAGVYEFEAIGYEQGGGAFFEIYEWLPDGSKVLLGDGPSPVYVPEPATIALLGFGGLSMLRIRRKR
jgi:hypothetical protein